MRGYAKLATLMGAYPEVAIVRRFAALSAQNILYLQAELVDLESRLRDIEDQDKERGPEDWKDCNLDWYQLSTWTDGAVDAPNEVDGPEPSDKPLVGRRWSTFLQIRSKLKEYSKWLSPCRAPHSELIRLIDEAVQQQVEFAKLEKPNPRDLRFLSDWLSRPDLGGIYLTGQDSHIWKEPDRLELAVLKARRNESIFTALLSDKFIHSFHQKLYWIVSLTSITSPLSGEYRCSRS